MTQQQTSSAPSSRPNSSTAVPVPALQPAWTIITGSGENRTERLHTPGGCLYRTIASPSTPGEYAVAMVFVPDQPGEGGAASPAPLSSVFR